MNKTDNTDNIKGMIEELYDVIVNASIYLGEEKQFQEDVMIALPELIEKTGISPMTVSIEQFTLNKKKKSGRVDIITTHEDNTVSIFEIKQTTRFTKMYASMSQAMAIGQLLYYQQMFHEIKKIKARLFLVDAKIQLSTIELVKNNNLDIILAQVNSNKSFILT